MLASVDIEGTSTPKRGDLLQTNVGDRRERTWMILSVHRLKPIRDMPRLRVWAERWWALEPEFRCRLAASAERAGGQAVFYRKKPERKAKPKQQVPFERFQMKRGRGV